MKINKSKHTIIETLSAYLDGQLTEREEQVLRQRLAEDAALRNQLEDLRQTRYVLRQTPKLKRRRSFVLSPEMVKQQRTVFRAMNVSRMISAAASVLLVVLLGSQYLFAGGMGMASAPMADMANYQMAEDSAAAEPMIMEAPLEEPAEEPAEEMDSVMADTAEESTGVAEAVESESAKAPVEQPADAADDVQGTQPPMGGGGEPPAEEGEAEQAVDEALPTATFEGDQRSVTVEKDVGELEGQNLDEGEDGARPTELPEEELLLPGEETEFDETQPSGLQISPLRVMQGVLLLLAVAGGLAAAYFRKKVR